MISFDSLFKLALLVGAALALDNPEWIGHWKAQMDISYDSVWVEYIADCDCTEPLE